MNPRSLRHRFEKSAKLLVLVQKHAPEVDCIFDPDKGSNGHLILDFATRGMSRSKMVSLGKDLQNKGYQFTEKKSPWLGQITYTGRADDKPTIILALPITKDRLAINEEAPEKPYNF